MADPAASAPAAPAPAQVPDARAGRSPAPAPRRPPRTRGSGPSSDSGPEAGSRRLLFSHDLVSGRYRLGALRAGAPHPRRGLGLGGRGGGPWELGLLGRQGARATRAGPARYAAATCASVVPEGVKRHVKETKVRWAGGRRGGRARGPAGTEVGRSSPGPRGEACRALPP